MSRTPNNPPKTKNHPVKYAKAAISKKIKPGGKILVSEALVKQGATNLKPKIHVKRGDLVILTTGSKEAGKGKTGKVTAVFPDSGKIIVEGINVVTKATKARGPMAKSGLIKQEAPIYASRVMLYSTEKKKGVRAEFRKRENID
jgi:large subunit ribosomal protein L24